MRVRTLWISGFSSFEKVQWAPGSLNVLIGPNGSGKSNLLRALDLIRASAAGNLRDFVLSRGGLPRLLWGGRARWIQFEITTAPDQASALDQAYILRVEPAAGSAGFAVTYELVEFRGPSLEAVPPRLRRCGDELTIRDDNENVAGGSAQHLPATETALSMVSALWSNTIPYQLQQQLKAWNIHQHLQVGEDAPIRRSAVARRETRISPNGQNLIPVLTTLYEGDFKDAIDSGMSAAFPDDYGELIFRETEPNRIQLYIRRKHGNREDSAADLSDGTLRFLVLVAILATPDPPPLIAIDEPEAGLHPSMLPIIAEFAAEAATRTQVILSTHSPQMLDAFGDTLPATTIFEWAGDHTELKTITGDKLKKWVQEYSLGRFMFSGEAAAVL